MNGQIDVLRGSPDFDHHRRPSHRPDRVAIAHNPIEDHVKFEFIFNESHHLWKYYNNYDNNHIQLPSSQFPLMSAREAVLWMHVGNIIEMSYFVCDQNSV